MCRRWSHIFMYSPIAQTYVSELMTHGKIIRENYHQFLGLKLFLL
jgi:hypothetical protein